MLSQLLHRFFCIGIIGLLFPFPVLAFVSPDQVAVLANSQSAESLGLADYYMERRSIPLVNRVDLDLPTTDTISRQVYDQNLIQSVREALTQKGLAKTIRVLVTVFGIPLRVQAPRPTAEEEEWIDDARQWKRSAMRLLREQEQQVVNQKASVSLPALPPVESIVPSADAEQSTNMSQIRKWRKQLITLLDDFHREIEGKADVEKKETLLTSREKFIRRMFGKLGMKAAIKRIPRLSDKSLREEVAVQQLLAKLMHQPTASMRTQAYRLVQEAFGLWGVLSFAQWEIERYRHADGSASVDSELSFLWWDEGTYPVAGRLPNPFYLGYSGQADDWPLPLLLVSRIDAPTAIHARRMIDQAMETESRGLSGNVYVDARGMKKGRPLSYGFYDADMQDFAKHFRRGSSYPVTLENTEQRLSQPGQAPNVAVYVGWYRLRHYEDAFTFNPGAIGYHIASGEAVSVHNFKEPGWCKNALERGITVTLGPVGEPYLDAFPLPTEFFGLLYSGKYSLVEAYYLSKRYVSWKMVLFGDPLYRPWPNESSRRQKVAKALLQERPLPVAPMYKTISFLERSFDSSKFPGKYVPFDSRILSP